MATNQGGVWRMWQMEIGWEGGGLYSRCGNGKRKCDCGAKCEKCTAAFSNMAEHSDGKDNEVQVKWGG
eukprot:13031402-Ditylum_brightwellii.AAC.1